MHYPRIWNTPWFDWVQYNGSIMQPMVRNAGESLGVSAELNLTDPSKGLFKSSVDIKSLDDNGADDQGQHAAEPKGRLLRPEIAEMARRYSAADRRRNWRRRARELYKTHCQECHRPPVTNEAFYDFNNKDWWTKNQAGETILRVENIPISHIGTDPAQAADMANRTVASCPQISTSSETSFALALGAVVEKTVNYIYDQQKAADDAAERQAANGNMPNELRADLAYKVRPLNGIWATPPYLHNGSVPTIEDLLGPPEERPKKFYLGSREYDPVKLGYKTDTDRQRFRIRHLDSRKLEHRPRIPQGIQQGQGNQGRDRTGVVAGRSKGADRVSQDALKSSRISTWPGADPARISTRHMRGDGQRAYRLTTSRKCGLIVSSSSDLSWCTRGSAERAAHTEY